MSIFPFIDPEALAASQDNTLPMFREYAYDYENNRLLLRDRSEERRVGKEC